MNSTGPEYRSFIAGLGLRAAEVITSRHEIRLVMCGECGPSVNSRDICQWCGGHAEPLTRERA